MLSKRSPLVAQIRKASTIGPQTINGRTVVLRQPRISDAAEWRRISLRDRELNEPFAPTSTSTWEERHTFEQWVRICVALRRQKAAGRTIPFVIEVDGKFAGRCAFTWPEFDSYAAEMSMWIDGDVAGGGVARFVGAMMMDYAFGFLRLRLLTGATGSENARANRGCEYLGMHHDATMASFFDAGGHRKPYNLWTVEWTESPEEGFVSDCRARAVLRTRDETRIVGGETARAGARRIRISRSDVMRAAYHGGKVLTGIESRRLIGHFQRPPTVHLGPAEVSSGKVVLRNRRRADDAVLSELGTSGHHDQDLSFVIELDGNTIGSCWFRQIYNLTAELGLAVADLPVGQEVAEAAADLLLGHAFDIGGERVWLAVPSDHDRRLAQRLGMTFEGSLARCTRGDAHVVHNELWATTRADYLNRESGATASLLEDVDSESSLVSESSDPT